MSCAPLRVIFSPSPTLPSLRPVACPQALQGSLCVPAPGFLDGPTTPPHPCLLLT